MAVNIGIIGTGFGASVHLPAFLRTEGCVVRGIAARDAARARAVAEAHSGLVAFGTWRELADSPEIDAVVIATPPAFHQEIASYAISAGKHVLCEKPFALTVDEAAAMCAAAENASVVAMVNFEFRLHPAFEALKEAVDMGDVGVVSEAKMRWTSGSWLNPGRPWSWQCDKTQGGGVLGALGVHLFDYLELLLGPVSAVKAEAGIAVVKRADEAGITRDVTAYDHCMLQFRMESGVAVSCELSNVAAGKTGQSIVLTGDRGSMGILNESVTDYARGFSIWKEEQWKKEESKVSFDSEEHDGRIALMRLMAARFIDAVSHGRKAEPSFFDGLRTQQILAAVEAGVLSGSWVDIPVA